MKHFLRLSRRDRLKIEKTGPLSHQSRLVQLFAIGLRNTLFAEIISKKLLRDNSIRDVRPSLIYSFENFNTSDYLISVISDAIKTAHKLNLKCLTFHVALVTGPKELRSQLSGREPTWHDKF